MNTKHTYKYVYNLLQKKRKHPDKKSETKWAEQFHDENLNWKTIYASSLRATKDIKLQNFNYKFLMRIIPTKDNIGHTTLCDFCCMEIETLDHLFWECIHVQLFRTNLSTVLQNYNVFIHFNLRNIMLGITEGTNQTEVQTKNFSNFTWKTFHFQSKYKKQHPILFFISNYI